MQYLEGLILGYENKETEYYVKYKKIYKWFIPDYLKNKIEPGDIVLARSEGLYTINGKKSVRAIPVLVEKVYESNRNEKRKHVFKIIKKNKITIDNIEELLDKAIKHQIVIKAGSWYKYNNKVLSRGRENAINYLKENRDIYENIKNTLSSIKTNKLNK